MVKPFFVELFAGSASLSRAMADAGFSVIAVDHVSNKPHFPITRLDLTSSSGQAIFWDIVESPQLVAIHLGLPCGTASRARERKIPDSLRRQGVPEPPPLRSPRYPLGLPGLSSVNAAKVAAANALLRFCLQVILFCVIRSIVELLRIGFSRKFADAYNSLQMLQFHSCCFGSKRKKLTGWLASPGVFDELSRFCQGDHEHEPFGVHQVLGQWRFDTRQPTQLSWPKLWLPVYPSLLPTRVSS